MRYVPGFRTYLPPLIQWQPTTASHDPNPPITIDAGLATLEGSLSVTLGAATLAATGTSTIEGALSATLGALTLSATGTSEAVQDTPARPGPAGGTSGRRRRDRQDLEAYYARLQLNAREEEERKRLEALAEAERALEEAESAQKAKGRREAVRRVFAALTRAAVTDQARREAAEAEETALAAIVSRETEAQRVVYLEALDRLNAEIEAVGIQIQRMYRRRQEEEEMMLRMWAA